MGEQAGMKFSTKEDIEAPIEQVFDMLSEFEMFERSAIRRGVEVQRLSNVTQPQIGMAWDARFEMRGKPRDLHLVLAQYQRPVVIKFDFTSAGIVGELVLDMIALSPRRTRLAVAIVMSPTTLSARVLIQSLRLAKANLSKRFKLKVAEYAKVLEDRYTRLA